ncbi:MAG TPA: hypothetical protein VFW30_02905 [Bryocella sp.]|nr:hypothetical protein [Bryocella sp.]
MKRAYISTIVPVALTINAALYALSSRAQDPVKHPHEICTRAYLTDSAVVSGVLFQTFENDANGWTCVRASADGKLLFQRTNGNDGAFTLGQKADKEESIPAILNGADLTGRGRPDMLISAWSGGAHCCRTDYIFELRPRFRLLATINDQDADLSHFAQLDITGPYYYLSADYIFSYWYGSFAGSPVEPVILEYRDDKNGGGFHLSVEKMRQPPPSKQEWDKALAQVENDIANDPLNIRTDLWHEVLHLLYTGQADLAWKFIDDASPAAQKHPAPDLSAFCSTLKESDYWRDLEPTITNMPKACREARPGR